MPPPAERKLAAPNDAGTHAFRGIAMARLGRFLEATRSIRQALRLDPHPTPGLLMVTSYVNWGAGRIREGVELLEQVRSANRDNVLARLGLVAYYEREGRHEEAQTVVGEILLVVPDLTVERAMQLIPGWEDLLGPQDFARAPNDFRAAGLP